MSGMKKALFSYRMLLILLLLFLAVSLVPLLLLAPYAVPCADDYSYGAQTHAVFTSSGSLTQTLAAALTQVKSTYRNWQGSFSAIFLMALQPAVFGARWYFLTPVLMLLSLLGGLFCFCLALFSGVFGLPRPLSGCVAAVTALLSLQLIPSPVQGLYWYNGAVYYTFFHGLALLAFALALRLIRRGGAGRQLLLCLLAVILGGGNYVTALSCAIVAVSGVLLLMLLRGRAWKRLLPPALCLLAALALSMAAPGNGVRQSASEHTPQVLPAILGSFRFGALYSLRWLRLPVLGALALLGVLFWPAARRCRFSFRCPLLLTLWSYCLLSAMFCPNLYALGDEGDKRLLNIIFYMDLLLLALNLFYWLGWLAARLGKRDPAEVRGAGLWQTLAAAALCLLCCALYLRAGGYTSLMALGAMRSGEARQFREAAEARLVLLEDAGVRNAVLEPYPVKPYVLFMDDITCDSADWRNEAMAAFYEKESVVLAPES